METNIEAIDPVLFQLGPLQIHWYAVLILTGALIGLWIAIRESERCGLPKDTFIDLAAIGIPISIIFARIYYVLFQWEHYVNNPLQIIAIWEGGLAMHGVLIGATLTLIIFAKVRNISFWKLADILAPSLILAQAIGRWGNFINQEAHGGPVTREFLMNLHLPEFIINQMYIDGVYYHPTFLYESVWNFSGFVLLMFLRRSKLRQGELFLTYIMYYSIGRFFIEGMRTDSLMLTEDLRMAQIISIILILVSMFVLWYRRKKGYADTHYVEQSLVK